MADAIKCEVRARIEGSELLFLISNVKFIQIIKRINQVYMMYTFGDHNNQVHKLQTSIKSQIEKNGMACNNGHSISRHSKEEKF